MCHLRMQNPSKFMRFFHIFYIVVNFLPFGWWILSPATAVPSSAPELLEPNPETVARLVKAPIW